MLTLFLFLFPTHKLCLFIYSTSHYICNSTLDNFIRNTSAFGNGAVAYIAYVQTESIDYIIKPVLKNFVTIIFKILPEKTATMSSPLIHEIKGQAFRFLKEKIRTARLVLTDVTPVQL